MPSPRFEVPSGTVDGSNTIFIVSMPYSSGTTAVFRNGLLQEKSLDDGWFETSPNLGIVTLKIAPSAFGYPDIIQIFFLDQSPSPAPLPESLVFKLKGIIRAQPSMRGSLEIQQRMTAHLEANKPLVGHLEERKYLRGSIKAQPKMKAFIKECV